MNGEHRLEPVRGEHEIVVQQDEIFSPGNACALVVRASVSEISFVQNGSKWSPECLQPRSRAVGAAVVDQNDFIFQIRWNGGLKAGDHGLRERQAVVEGDDERDLHGGALPAGANPPV